MLQQKKNGSNRNTIQYIAYVGFEVRTEMSIKGTVFSDLTPLEVSQVSEELTACIIRFVV
jgi:hypothetical protein